MVPKDVEAKYQIWKPEKEIDYDFVTQAARIDCILDEYVAFCRSFVTTLELYAANDLKFQEAWKKGQAEKRRDNTRRS